MSGRVSPWDDPNRPGNCGRGNDDTGGGGWGEAWGIVLNVLNIAGTIISASNAENAMNMNANHKHDNGHKEEKPKPYDGDPSHKKNMPRGEMGPPDNNDKPPPPDVKRSPHEYNPGGSGEVISPGEWGECSIM